MVRLNTALLERGLTLGSQHLLIVPGRRTGEPRRTPVSITTLEHHRFIVAAFPDAAWVKNVRMAPSCLLVRGRRSESVRLDELPVEARGPVLRAFLEQVPGGVRFFGRQTPDEIVARADRYPVFAVL
jgi:hypothetical protein